MNDMINKWYKGIYRRNLVDMHIADWSEEFLSQFDADGYYQNLVKAKIQSPMIYLQSHTGLCHYPTKSGKTHTHFAKNPRVLNELIDKCKAGGMKVVGYYSLIFNNWATDTHPDWEMVNADGTTWRDHGQRYGLCCPNNQEYRAFVLTQMQEMAELFPNLDGIFYDMPYWEVVCHCPACKVRWEKEVGGRMPQKLDWQDEKWRIFVRKRQEWMAEFAMFVSENSKKILPFATCELNFAAGIACDWLAGSTEGINAACEFTGGDLYGDLYNHSFTCKYYYGITKNQPFEYMTCRCNKKLREHTISKPETDLEAEVMLTAAHHGASLIIDAVDPDGGLDARTYERLGKVFAKQIPYEKYMDKGELYAETAVYFDSTTQFSSDGKSYNKECAIRAGRTLIEEHILVKVIANGNMDNLSQYQMIIAPTLKDFNNSEILKFISYVEQGGTLYLSGKAESRLIKEFFGGEIKGETYGNSPFERVWKGYDEVQAYVTPTDEKYKAYFGEFNEKYPLPIIYKLPIMENYQGEVKAKIILPYTDPDDNTVFASIHSNPPARGTEIPAIIEIEYGKGKVIWSAATLENDDRENFKEIFAKIVKANVKRKIKVQASKYVESIIFKDGEDYYVNLFDLNFANDLVERKFTIKAEEGYQLYDLLDNTPIKMQDGAFVGTFEKYRWFVLKRK
ncbi:MAG: beta-galactosidase trimerization domain-containing protein [Clostridia bacterium]|nr:beta-galactosidase trimerization domain-containing protein [Clostridia bacterium]